MFVLNTKQATYFADFAGKGYQLDFAMVSAGLKGKFKWNPYFDPLDSDHLTDED